MGRKIPGRKHRGVRDPEKQHAERFAKIKDKINAPPVNPEEQQIPKSLSRVIELKNQVKEGKFNKKKKQNKSEITAKPKSKFNKKYEKPQLKFKQRPGESDRDFKRRMNLICNEVVKEALFEDKYNVNIIRNEQGEVQKVEKRPPDEIETLRKKVLKEKKNKKGNKKKQTEGKEERLTKSHKRAIKKATKKENKILEKENDELLKPYTEYVKFGEVAHAPPTLSHPRKVYDTGGAPRPGKKPLLLKSMLSENSDQNAIKGTNKDKAKSDHLKVTKTINKKGKRKHLPNALRRQLDTQQKEIIEAYKKLKTKNH